MHRLTARLGSMASLQQVEEASPADVLHREVVPAIVGLPVVEDGDNVRVVQTRECPRLEEEALLEGFPLFVRGLQAWRREEFERDRTVQRLLSRPIDRGLTTACDAFLDQGTCRQ